MNKDKNLAPTHTFPWNQLALYAGALVIVIIIFIVILKDKGMSEEEKQLNVINTLETNTSISPEEKDDILEELMLMSAGSAQNSEEIDTSSTLNNNE